LSRSDRLDVKVFVWATGQDENIGDSLLRRGYLDALRAVGPLRVWVSGASRRFLSGLGLRPGDATEADFGAWYRAALAAALRGPIVLALNAGEVPVSRGGAFRLLRLLPLLALVRLRGGTTVWAGAGVPVHASAFVPVYRIAARSCGIALWRDRETLDTLSTGRLAPDWAFALAGETAAESAERDVLALILRGDRPFPDDTWIRWVRMLADDLALTPVVVVQVERDAEAARRLAERLAGRVLEFSSAADHEHQERLVREMYRRTRLAIGDRLHGLIVAATEGAAPLGWVPSSSGKIARHFRTIGLDFVGEHEGSPAAALPRIGHDELLMWSRSTASAVDDAARRLEGVASEIAATAHASASR
jgi:hypothetical protein